MKKIILLLVLSGLIFSGYGQKKKKNIPQPVIIESDVVKDLALRSIGPSITSGRISDIAVDPIDENTWFITVASGGVWKTINSGTTWSPIFDKEGSYSIGCVTIDPGNRNTIWIGTGENNSQRSVGYGDGIYKSVDGGKSWSHMGLKASEHIGNIVIHPNIQTLFTLQLMAPFGLQVATGEFINRQMEEQHGKIYYL